jgi:hypothetical protein
MTDSPSTLLQTERMLGIFQSLEISPADFNAAYDAPIGEHVEKSYLSWAFAMRYFKEHFPALYVAFEEHTVGWPVFGEPGCYLLRPYLTDGTRRTPALVFPLMDNKHNALKELNARAVSDNIQRAAVKTIATYTGLGLRLYAGEDIPKSDDAAPVQEKPKRTPKAAEKAAEKPAEAPAAQAESAAFDGKAALLQLCKANPLGLAGGERAGMMAGKAALEHLGLSKGEDVKDAAMFANVVTTMVAAWAKNEGLTIEKSAMEEAIGKLRAICEEGTVEQAIKGVEVFVQGKR